MTSTLVYTSTAPAADIAQTMRDIAARAAAGRRVAEGLANHDPVYGVWVCTCTCRRCIPYKNDCGGCVAEGGCALEFMSHQDAEIFFSVYGVVYNARTRRFE